MKLVVAAIQMPSTPMAVLDNVERADVLLREAHLGGADLAVLPEMFNTGYDFRHDWWEVAEDLDGPTLKHLRRRSTSWGMTIAAGFIERSGPHLYDSLAVCQPGGTTHVYRKRQLVFWERFRFRPGREPLIVPTRFGRLGLAICADMIYRKVWESYRDRIDLAVVSAAWPEFRNPEHPKAHWLMGHVGPLAASIPPRVALDLGVPVVLANQCGPARTTIPLLGMWIRQQFPDRFAGSSCVCDGRHGEVVAGGVEEEIVLASVTVHPARGPSSCRSTSRSARKGSSFASAPS